MTTTTAVGVLHEIGKRIAAADPLNAVLDEIVHLVASAVPCDSCFVYVLEGDDLVLRASKNPHHEGVERVTVRVCQGIMGWAAEPREAVAVGARAFADPRFQLFNRPPADEAFMSVPIRGRNRLAGVINVQHRQPHTHTPAEIRLVATIGLLVGSETERGRLETENLQLAERLETRKILDRAKGILQRDLAITEEEAYRTIQTQSRQRRRPTREIASAIVLAEELRRAASGG